MFLAFWPFRRSSTSKAGRRAAFRPNNKRRLIVDQLEDRVVPTHTVGINVDSPSPFLEGVAVNLSSTVTGAVEVVEPATYAWTVMKDGVLFATGDAATLTFTPDDNATYEVSLTVVDDVDTATDSETLTVENQAPVVAVSGPTTGTLGQSLAFTLTATDADADETAGFTFNIDWNDDGTVDETVAATPGNGAGVTVNHVFTTPGANTFSVTATDQDGATSAAVTHTVTLEVGAAVVDGVLTVSGSVGNDVIKFVPKGKQSAEGATMKVFINGVNQGVFTGVNSIEVDALAGNDIVHLAGSIRVPATVLGGEGDDRIKGAKGGDMLVGGPGNDHLNGHQGRDVLIGGEGVDRVLGGPGEDVLISGSTIYDADGDALAAILAIWNSSDSFNQRVAALTDAAAAVHLTTEGTGATVIDDGVADRLNGASGKDFLLSSPSDATDQKAKGGGKGGKDKDKDDEKSSKKSSQNGGGHGKGHGHAKIKHGKGKGRKK